MNPASSWTKDDGQKFVRAARVLGKASRADLERLGLLGDGRELLLKSLLDISRALVEAPTGKRETKTAFSRQDFYELVRDVVKVQNPQVSQQTGEIGEGALMRSVCRWFHDRDIKYIADPKWGVFAEICSHTAGASNMPGVLFNAHLDSVNPSVGNVRIEGDWLKYDGDAGLDCKTGVAIILGAIEHLRTNSKETKMQTSCPWNICVYFSVGEESGQKGAMRFPIRDLLWDEKLQRAKACYCITVDRKTNARNCPRDRDGNALRHVVGRYKGVDLIGDRMRDVMLKRLGHAFSRAGIPSTAIPVKAIESPNNADTLELKARWDIEVVFDFLYNNLWDSCKKGPHKVLDESVMDYIEITRKVLSIADRIPADERVSGMYESPRKDRYGMMKDIQDKLYSLDDWQSKVLKGTDILMTGLEFAAVNLSYDYSEEGDRCSLPELDSTVKVLLGFCESYFGDRRQDPKFYTSIVKMRKRRDRFA
eukprot:jgi/Bigna1/86021/estExt_fgenesh1_pg.C_70277